jgi:hypothetical protein
MTVVFLVFLFFGTLLVFVSIVFFVEFRVATILLACDLWCCKRGGFEAIKMTNKTFGGKV